MYLRCRKVAQFITVAAVAVALSGCDIAVNGEGGLHFDVGAKAEDQWTRSYKVGSGARFELINVNGKITAEASDGNTIEVRAERTAKGSSEEVARNTLEKIEMREEVGDTRVRIEVRPPRLRGGGHEIKWTIKVPKGVAVDLRTVNGGVKMDGLQGDVRARATNGGITGSRLLAANVDASVTNGGVEIELVNAPTAGSFDLESVNGGVSLILPGDSKVDIAARCVNGGISLNGLDVEVSNEEQGRSREGMQAAKTFRRRLDGKLNGGGARVSLETVNGGVKISRTTT